MYILEGNIGVGKTTFLDLLNKNVPEIKVFLEPTGNWTKTVYGQSLLANFYKEPKRWAYTMETLTMVCRVQNHVNDQNNSNQRFIVERSIYSGHYCFALNGYENGYFSKIEWSVYNEWVNFLINKRCRPPHGFIYLKASPEVCFERIKKRNRFSEKDVTLAYIKQIEKYHEQFLVEKRNIFENLKNVPVLILDCNEDFIKNEQNMQKHIFKVKKILESSLENYKKQTNKERIRQQSSL